MLIQPGANSPSTLDSVDLVRLSSRKYISVSFMDDSGTASDISETITPSGDAVGELDLQVTNLDGSAIYSETYWPPPIPDTRRITHPTTGKYQIQWGTGTNETSNAGGLLFNWHLRQNTAGEDIYRTQLVEVVSPRVLSLLPIFRLQIDKSIKVVVPEQYCTLGYSDAQLIVYLQMGMARINGAQPYPSWMTLDVFPLDRGQELLIRSATITALESQYLFAVDTDVPSFADQGHSFVITHAAQLKALRDSMVAELAKDIREFKLHYIGSGSIGAEFRMGWGYYQLLASSPPGSVFRRALTTFPV